MPHSFVLGLHLALDLHSTDGRIAFTGLHTFWGQCLQFVNIDKGTGS